MRTLSIFLALTFAASAASAQSGKTATTGHAQARVPQQHTRSTPTPKAAPTAKTAAPAAKPAAPHVASAAPATTKPAPTGEPVPTTAATAATAATVAAVPATDAPVAPTPAAATEPAPAISTTEPAAASSAAAIDADGDADEAGQAAHTVKIPLPAKPPTANVLTVDYQRVGRAILKLQDQRGVFDCGNLQQRFKAIKLEAALATPASRMQLYVTLTELSMKIERMRGIKLDSACLANPLAPGCM